MKKEKVEVIEMQQTTFVQRHAKKILFATGVVVAAGAYYIHKKYNIEMSKMVLEHDETIKEHTDKINKFTDCFKDVYDIAIEEANMAIREKQFEIDLLKESIANLDPKIPVNLAVNIPERKQKIEALEILIEQYQENIERANTRKLQVL